MKRTLFFCLLLFFALNATAADLVVNSSRSYPLAQVQSLEIEYNNETASTCGIFTFSDGSTERVADLRTIAFNFKTALDNTQGNNALLIYPNPAYDYIQIENAQAGDMLMYNLQGSVMMQTRVAEGNSSISVTELPQGTYLLLLNNKIFKLNKQ